jgi:hypothetical protein
MKKCILMMVCGLSAAVLAGSLNPPAGPTAGTMKTLEDVEPRKAIRQADIPLTISASGSYYLAENVSYSGGRCIQVTAHDVTLDLSGFTLNGNGSGTYGIYLSACRNVEIRNGVVCDFTYGIIAQAGSGCETLRVFDIRLLSCSSDAVHLRYCNNCQVKGCTIANGSQLSFGICVGDNSIVSGNAIYNNNNSASSRRFMGIETEGCCTVSGNTIYNNGTSTTADYVAGIWTGYGCTVASNTVRDNGDFAINASVYGIYAGEANVVRDNACYTNGTSADNVRGISCSSCCTVTNNTSYRNGETANGTVYGIFNGAGCTVTGNTAYDNGNGGQGNVYGIRCGGGCTITGNSAHSNGTYSGAGTSVYGIFADQGCTVVGNASRNNGWAASATRTVYGIYLVGYNLVNNNSASGNEDTNINNSATSSYGTNVGY